MNTFAQQSFALVFALKILPLYKCINGITYTFAKNGSKEKKTICRNYINAFDGIPCTFAKTFKRKEKNTAKLYGDALV